MSSQGNDRRDDERRDIAVETLLSRQSGMNGSSGPCPDAEVIAAYADHSLDENETARWETHFAQCERCQDVLSALAQGVPMEDERLVAAAAAPMAAARPAPSAVTEKPKGSNGKFWLIAVAAAAAIVAFVILRPSPNSNGPAQNTAVANNAQQNASAPPPVSSGTEGDTAAAHGQPRKKGPETPSNPAINLQQAAEEPKIHINAVVSPNSDLNVDGLTAAQTGVQESAEKKDARDRSAGALGGIAGGARNTTTRAMAANNAPAATTNSVTEEASVQAEVGTARSNQAINDAMRAASGLAKTQVAPAPKPTDAAAAPQSYAGAASDLNAVLVLPLQGNVMYRIGLGGRIEKSSDSGMTWVKQESGTNANLIAGSAPNNQICWVVGDGVILHTSDGGATWTKAANPQELNGAQVDWTAVFATDAQNAHVATIDGRRFATKDGGATWTASGQ